MKAACWMAPRKVEVREVPDPQILNRRDAIVKVSSAAICGSDLHLFNGFNPTMMPGDVIGHEFMGEVVEVGPDVRNLRRGDRVVIPFPIACGGCEQCLSQNYMCCENSNPNAHIAEKLWGHSPAAIYGYSHALGGFAGGQAEYVRVPFADVDHLTIEDDFTDEQVLYLSDAFPTGYMGAEMCEIKSGDVVAVWGCGPVGQFAIASAYLLGAERVIAIDRFDYRLQMARDKAGALTVNYEEVDSVKDALDDLTAGRGPDKCIDAVGMEAHSPGIDYAYDRAKQAMRIELDRPIALRQAILSCRNGGIVAAIGAYYGLIDKFPMGACMNRGITIKTSQCHVHRYMQPLLERVRRGEIDPSFVTTHVMPLADAPRGYDMFLGKKDNCEKVVLKA